ncbi:non-ribosomal peptide synthetase [Bradyrhizobium sp. Leaf401]|uniref:non-ribosomal peptide synthetase n=1 Tax=Bradyrhizobium sp. Leaf401 TaxID=2876564 RepID=UPI001E4DA1C1|nr:non-ribosomal peptide synthetase [Bradyrhizobium sp. Leaf401]
MTISSILESLKAGCLSPEQAFQNIREIRRRSAMSEGQKGLWMLQKLVPEMAAYNLPICLRIFRQVDAHVLRKAFEWVLDQTPVLADSIVEREGIPCREISHRDGSYFLENDVSELSDDELRAYLKRITRLPFRLERGPLLRVELLKHRQSSILLIVIHHIAFDAGSIIPFLEGLFQTYQRILSGDPIVTDPLPPTYADFVAWERDKLTASTASMHSSFWKEYLAGAPPFIEWATARPQDVSEQYEGRTLSRRLSERTKGDVIDFCKNHQITPAVFFLGVFKLVIAAYSGEREIVVGVSTTTRPTFSYMRTIGYFVNMIPVRAVIARDRHFAEFIHNLQLNMAECLDHSAYPFAAIVRDINPARAENRAPIFQVSYTYQSLIENRTSGGADPTLFEFVEGLHQEGEYEIALDVSSVNSEIIASLKYNPYMFDETQVIGMADLYATLIESVLGASNRTIGELPTLSPRDRQALADWNSTETSFSCPGTIPELVSCQVERSPSAIAVECGETRLTYKELEDRSDFCARLLRDRAGPQSFVGVYIERSADMIVALLGVLKAGAAYVPLDIEHPIERQRHVIAQSGISTIITQFSLVPALRTLTDDSLNVIPMEEVMSVDQPGVVSARAELDRDAPAYLMYTSGSTGTPKGVIVPHKAFVNVLLSMNALCGLDANDRLLALTTLSFDIAGFELFGPLIAGACCVVCSVDTARDPGELRDEIRRSKPTVMQGTPTLWSMLFRSGWKSDPGLKMICGGEPLPSGLRERFTNSDGEAWNFYGPTETTIWSTAWKIERHGAIRIGKPLANTKVFVVNGDRQLVPIGSPGEILIAGDGLALGYHNMPDLTAERFLIDQSVAGGKLYKTGDHGRWLPDGTLQHLGRMDDQIKLRGYRIELGEIEAHLSRHPAIRDCAVVTSGDEEEKRLVAVYVPVSHQKGTVDSRQLRRYLDSKIPGYMVPSSFVEAASLPLSPNGKIDRRALVKWASEEQRQPSSDNDDVTTKIIEVWKSVLGADEVLLDDSFFEIGGNSMLALAAASRIASALGQEFGVDKIFRYVTVRAICQHLRGERRIKGSALFKRRSSGQGSNGSRRPEYLEESVAIVGISCQFPGASDQQEFWHNLIEERNCAEVLSDAQLLAAGVPENVYRHPRYVRSRLAIERGDRPNDGPLGLSGAERELMDPQLRLLLQHSMNVCKDAGYSAHELSDTAVVISTSNNFHRMLSRGRMVRDPGMQGELNYDDWLWSQSGATPTMISYKLGFEGPSYSVHSNSSSGLVALHLAHQSLMRRETRCALVGAASVSPITIAGYLHQEGSVFSPTGCVRPFDEWADGMVIGEGVAAILLKRTVDALDDNDNIYAILRGGAVNNDGKSRPAYQIPGINGQVKVVQAALQAADVNPATISYVEAHATGTKLGDFIEFNSLSEAFREYTDKVQFCGLGSVSGNIGHVDTASGLAGTIKVALSLHNGEVPATINFNSPNQNIHIGDSPFYFLDKPTKLPTRNYPARAAVSSFGVGGTNAHLIFEAAPPRG